MMGIIKMAIHIVEYTNSKVSFLLVLYSIHPITNECTDTVCKTSSSELQNTININTSLTPFQVVCLFLPVLKYAVGTLVYQFNCGLCVFNPDTTIMPAHMISNTRPKDIVAILV